MTSQPNPAALQGARGAVLALTCLVLAVTARADDTEIFVADASASPSGGGANILFIIDTSASMDAETSTQAPWNPALDFSGCYRRDAIYFSTGTQAPPCSSTAYVLKSANRCAATTVPFASIGQFTTFALGWDEERQRWDPLAPDNGNRLLECESDRGIDGEGGELFANDGSDGPWGPDDAAEPGWNTQYTLFDGNWLNWRTNPPTEIRTRLEIVQDVVVDIIANLTSANVGLMQFNRDEGGAVIQAVADVDTTRAAMISAVEGLPLLGRTPLSETLYEAALYFRGGTVDYGNIGPNRSVAAARIGGSSSGEQYRSPVSEDCQKNFIILLTDGEPNADLSAAAKIQALPGFSDLIGNCDGSGEGACLDDLAGYLAQADLDDGIPGLQNVTTYTIGFGGVDAPILENTARRGGGQYYLADDTGSLAAVLRDIVAGIVDRSSTFTAPALPANAYSRSSSERDAYVAVFQPTGTVHWPGNLKKYRFSGEQLVGQDGRIAVNPATGFFLSDAFSFWSAERDGGRVNAGGAASRLLAGSARRVYTDIAGSDLSADDNRIEIGNGALTPQLLGVEDEAARDRLVNWIGGADVANLDGDDDLDEPRRQMGDPLHVRPVTLSYGASATTADTVVFVASNDGFLHAIDADTGSELWAFLPSRLLDRQAELLANPQTTARRYGLDGEIRLWIEDNDNQPGIDSDEETAILLFGMGRGGDAVFAVDVTERTEPRLLWQIDRNTPEFAAIGQVWAAPEMARIRIGGDTPQTVAVVSGGYDDSQDNRRYHTDTVGNAVYFIDALTGERLWSAGPPGRDHDLELEDMQHSIPAAPRVLDLTRDGLADRFYVGDMGGRVWRFDIRQGETGDDLVEGGMLASLGGADLDDPPANAVRRFYNTPDVVFVNCVRGNFLAVNLGSGYRGHPLDTTVEDAFFSIRDVNLFGVRDSTSYTDPTRYDDLFDITDDVAPTLPRDAGGWLLRLTQASGEKVLSEATTFDSRTFFTSFSPGGAVAACVGGLGVNRAYEVDACSGSPLTNLDGSTEPGPLEGTDRFRILNQTGIAPESVFLFPQEPGEGPTRCIGLVCFPSGDPARLRRTYWSQQQPAE